MSTSALPNTYVVGQIVFLEDVITDPTTGQPVDDATDVVTVYQPDGTTASPAPTVTPGASGSGTYTAQFTPTQAGWHEFVWQSTQGGAGASRGWFYVSPVP
jgi:hypothetical protein